MSLFLFLSLNCNWHALILMIIMLLMLKLFIVNYNFLVILLTLELIMLSNLTLSFLLSDFSMQFYTTFFCFAVGEACIGLSILIFFSRRTSQNQILRI